MITNNEFKLNLTTLSHLIAGSTRYSQRLSITIPRIVLLLDVSKWQGDIDFVKMKDAGVDGVIIKCGQGTAKDPQFDANWQKAKEAGLARGSYWFWDSRVNPTTQASNWWNWIKADPGELKHYGDYEESYGGSFGGWQSFKTFMDYMQTMNPGKIGLYTGYYYWIANSPNALTNSGSLNWFGQFELWMAWYTTNPADVLIPKPWTKLTLWQYGTMGMDGKTPNGIRYGAQSMEIDENNFDGDDVEYKAHYGLTGAQPPPTEPPIEPDPPTGGSTMYKGKTNTSAKVWEAIGGTQINMIPANTTVEGDAPSGGYAKITAPAQYRGYTKTQWLTGYVLVTTPPVEPPDEEPTDEEPTDPPPATTLPATVESTDVWKDDAGVVIATYKGSLTKQ